jgi:nucleotide-binding universal stress UspA family protein
MIRSILLALADVPGNLSARNYAFWLAKKKGSRIHAVALIDIAVFEVPVLGTPDGFMPSVVTPPLKESRTLMNELTEAAKGRLEHFSNQCASRGIPCSVEIKTGIPGEIVGRMAIAHDIVIVSRTGYNQVETARETMDSVVAPVIRHSVRPVLVAGTEFPEESDIQKVLVAYDGSSHSARALLAAAEIAARPGVECILVTVAQSAESGRELIAPAESFLSHHGVAPIARVVTGSKPSEVIREMVVSGKADLVIMGAYGHSPIREVLFGSTTERVLSHCTTNVILQS